MVVEISMIVTGRYVHVVPLSHSLTHSHRISFHVKLCIQFCMHKSFLCIHKNAFYLFLVAGVGVEDDFFLNLEMHFFSTFF